MRLIKPPAPIDLGSGQPSLFLAGSIEMGQAEDWQVTVERGLADLDCVVLNPRREKWDPSWEQTVENPPFLEQVEWELLGLELATVVLMYFAPTTKSPIALLELGLWARRGKLIVYCPAGFWRKGNVDIVCRRYGVEQVESLEALIARGMVMAMAA